ncbi:pilus assembly PilX family protein [Cupriavidus neocaledonicus]|uniref:Pilus assembly protein PilX n=1 Tax=Cupriavidus neocaledonicus TaxID=1040979 RepID=A0A375H7I4_9BURK|nr:PilX N-terminal domain-containing pilus assembly protein [Cupriavidus neocaledonicus]SOZ35715.1 putative type-4 fimbrial biogenesis transmembrane pilX-related protein precursor [Cupriavidus neocaledonicus]SPD47682.1 Pilus assembly protein PilX [Cupriavidus neocaledonicus]
MTRAQPARFSASAGAGAAPRGYVLIIGLLFLLILSLLSVTMFRGFGLQEKIAGNTREKQRAFEAAQGALQYGEWWLGQGNGSAGAACNSVIDANDPANLQVCANALADPASLPWTPARAEYLPPSMRLATAGSPGGLNGNDVNYARAPSLYIHYLGLSPDGLSMLFRVTGAGYGGSDGTAAVVQSTYQLGAGTRDLGKE